MKAFIFNSLFDIYNIKTPNLSILAYKPKKKNHEKYQIL